MLRGKSTWKNVFVWIIGANIFIHPLMNISGYHRFRVPIEPLFAVLAACGFCHLLPLIMKYTNLVKLKILNSIKDR